MKRTARKLLVASIGVAAVSYACTKKQPDPPPEPVGNLVAPTAEPRTEPPGSGTATPPEPPEEPVGNLVAPQEPEPAPATDAGKK